jgi:sec-independent protein translocase protein TatA
MSNAMLAMLNMWEIILIIAVVVLLFGAKKLPELARGLGQGIKEFKKTAKEDSAPPAPPAPPKA